jgi:abortive infection bacteriophage resistance protein
MGKKATTVEDQLTKLIDRGLIFEPEISQDKAKEILLDIGYYRLGFYWFPFEKGEHHENENEDDKHNFIEGTKFNDVVCLYYLDVDLKKILSEALNRIEIHFRTQVIYIVSNEYLDLPTWFASTKVMDNDFVKAFPKYYDSKFKKNNKTIRKHHVSYPNDIYAPAWKTLEFLTFGTIFTIFHNLKSEDLKKKIALAYGIKKVSVFENYFRTIIFIRNICAHSGVLFDSNTPKGISVTPLVQFNDNNRHSLDSSIKVILYVLSKISTTRSNEIKNRINEKFDDHLANAVIFKIIKETVGYKKYS